MLLRKLRILQSRSGVVSRSMKPRPRDFLLRDIGQRGGDRLGQCDCGGFVSGPLFVDILVEILPRSVVCSGAFRSGRAPACA